MLIFKLSTCTSISLQVSATIDGLFHGCLHLLTSWGFSQELKDSFISRTEGWKRREEYLKSGFWRCRGSETAPMWGGDTGLFREQLGERDASNSVAVGFGLLLRGGFWGAVEQQVRVCERKRRQPQDMQRLDMACCCTTGYRGKGKDTAFTYLLTWKEEKSIWRADSEDVGDLRLPQCGEGTQVFSVNNWEKETPATV